MSDTINHPKHYNQHPTGIECITIIEHFTFNRIRADQVQPGDHIQEINRISWGPPIKTVKDARHTQDNSLYFAYHTGWVSWTYQPHEIVLLHTYHK